MNATQFGKQTLCKCHIPENASIHSNRLGTSNLNKTCSQHYMTSEAGAVAQNNQIIFSMNSSNRVYVIHTFHYTNNKAQNGVQIHEMKQYLLG
jgi:hypothetical protein